MDVARDGLHPDPAAAGRANRARRPRPWSRRAPPPHRRPRDHRRRDWPTARRRTGARVTSPEAVRSSAAAVDVARAHVAARRVDAERARGLERHVAGRRLDLDVAERALAPRGPPSRRGASRSLPAGQRTWTPTFGPRPTRKPDLRFSSTTTSWPPPRSIISTLRLRDRLPRDVVVAQRHELDLDARGVASSRRRPRRR